MEWLFRALFWLLRRSRKPYIDEYEIGGYRHVGCLEQATDETLMQRLSALVARRRPEAEERVLRMLAQLVPDTRVVADTRDTHFGIVRLFRFVKFLPGRSAVAITVPSVQALAPLRLAHCHVRASATLDDARAFIAELHQAITALMAPNVVLIAAE